MKLKTLLLGFTFSIISIVSVVAQDTTNSILIINATIFDGTSEHLKKDLDVLIENNIIKKISKNIKASNGTQIIDAKGATLSPGFIDAHTHLLWNLGLYEQFSAPLDYQASLALIEGENTLMRGFTTIRDVAGNIFGVKKAIDENLFVGPRIYSSGAAIGMTAGHGDWRSINSRPRQHGGAVESEVERIGMSVFADGTDEMLLASRLRFRNGAHFIKLFVGGAVAGLYDPLDITEYSFEEIKTAVDEAKRWNTYVAAHTYTDQSTKQAIEAGVKSLEHCNFISEETIKLAVEKGCYISTQTGVYLSPAPESFTPEQKERQQQAAEGLDGLMTLLKKHKVKVGFGSDLIGSIELKKMQSNEFTNRIKWFTPVEILRQATSINAEILALSGPRNPYPGKLGVIEEGALADILLIDGNPLEDISILATPEKSLVLIIKNGVIYKNTIK